jgi:serine/threonine-protein kinase
MLSSVDETMDLEACAYKVVRRIGGGMTSTVFEAVTPERRRFALKVPLSDDATVRVRFLLEAAALARIRHENVVPLLKLQRTPSGMPCIVMPLLVGCTLREHLFTTGRISPERAAYFVSDTLRGLDAAHRVGVIHRDLTPSNLFIGHGERESRSSTRAIVLDLGSAKIDDVSTPLPESAASQLSPAYLSPELILGERVDPRTDVYSAGVLLFEAITGRPPFVGRDRAQVMEAHLDRTPPRLDVVADVGPALAEVVARALEKRRDRRWPTARAFARAIDASIAC